MAFWAKKKVENEADKREALTNNLLKKKDDKKGAPPKRIDNLRIAQKLSITLKSLGTGNEYHFLTKDLSSTGMFVLCSDHKRYPFIVGSTLIETVVNLQAENDQNGELHRLQCLCKIARMVEASGPNGNSGYGVRIIQIAPEERTALENFIATHGSPENFVPYSGGGAEPQPPPPELMKNNVEELGTDTTASSAAPVADSA
jgi:hypothetical protein